MIDYSIIIILIPLLYLLIRGLKVTFLDIKNYLENLKYKKRIQNSKPDFSKPIKIIGVGGGGSSIVDYLVTKYPKKFSALILNSDKNALFSKSVKNKILLEKQDEYGCGSNTSCGFNLINDEVIVKLKEFINEDKNVYIFSTLGGSCGSGSIKAICQNLDIKDLEINYILTLPFNWEGGTDTDLRGTQNDITLKIKDETYSVSNPIIGYSWESSTDGISYTQFAINNSNKTVYLVTNNNFYRVKATLQDNSVIYSNILKYTKEAVTTTDYYFKATRPYSYPGNDFVRYIDQYGNEQVEVLIRSYREEFIDENGLTLPGEWVKAPCTLIKANSILEVVGAVTCTP